MWTQNSGREMKVLGMHGTLGLSAPPRVVSDAAECGMALTTEYNRPQTRIMNNFFSYFLENTANVHNKKKINSC